MRHRWHLSWAIALILPVPATARVVISEFRCRGPMGGNDEFVEIFNAGTETVDVSGWKLWASNSSGYTSVRATIPAGTTLPPRTYLLFVNSASGGYSGSVPGDVTYTTGIGDNGGIAIVDEAGNLVDQVGMANTSAYYEGTHLPPFSTVNKDQSYERRSLQCGPDQDTDDNQADFEYRDGFSSPQNSRSCRPSCAGDPCISNPDPVCTDPWTLEVSPEGICGGNFFCEYPPISQTCAFGCVSIPFPPHCSPDPCEGVVCDTPPNRQCYEPEGTCSAGTCNYSARAPETPCDDGDLCSVDDACDDQGTCRGTMRLCPLPDPECRDGDTVSRIYLASACRSETGLCEATWQDTSCVRGCDPATGYCVDDPCAGVICDSPPATGCHESTGVCVDGLCHYAPLDSGTPCDDGDPCTDRDVCEDGTCAGTPKVCHTPPDVQCYEPTGACVDGTCRYELLQAGTPCDDGDPCTTEDACEEGSCRGMPKVCEVPAPWCLDTGTSRVGLQASCDPAQGVCVATSRDVPCGEGGCQEATGLCAPHPVISAFRTRGPGGGNDEFIEIHNPGDEPVAIGSWTIRASNQSGLTGVRFTFPAGTVMAPRTFLLLANQSSNGYSETTDPDFTYGTGITDTGGIAIVRDDDQVVDAVGMDPGSAYREGTPLAPTTSNLRQAYLRKTLRCGPDQDLDDNATDFLWITDFRPRNSRSCRLECAGAPCILPPPDECLDDHTRKTHEALCQDGSCEYPERRENCPFGCRDGRCMADPCENVVCDTPPNPFCYEAQGTCAEGVCRYVLREADHPCDDGNPCTTEDQCGESGTCTGSAVVCPPRPPECLSPTVSRSFAGGECSLATGECVYPHVDTQCPFGCDASTGHCLGDPCLGVTCDEPPSACHRSPGLCALGRCTYPLRETGSPCDDGDPCTVQDVCDEEGACQGAPMVCRDPGDPCREELGRCIEGQCHYDRKPVSSPCDDGDPCTTGDRCTSEGICLGESLPGCGEDLGGPDGSGSDEAPLPDDSTPPIDSGIDEETAGIEDAAPRPDVLEDPGATGDAGGEVPTSDETSGDDPSPEDLPLPGDETSSRKKSGGCLTGASVPGPWWILPFLGLLSLVRRRR